MSLDFQNIELKDVAKFMAHWEQTDQRSSDYCFPILWGWAGYYGYQAATHVDGGLYWLRQTKPKIYNLAPIGNWHRDDWAHVIEEYFGKKADFWLVPETLLNIWKSQFGDKIKAADDRGNWEYLYDINALAKLAGNHYMRKRNRVNQFRRRYAYEYKPITPALLPAVSAFQQAWCQANVGDHLPGIAQENDGIQLILDHWTEIPNICGGVIEVDGRIAAYTIGELAYDMLLVHFEKASLEYGAAYQVINRDFIAHMLSEHPSLVKVNREEDMNDPGLREAKESYLPNSYIKKFHVRVCL